MELPAFVRLDLPIFQDYFTFYGKMGYGISTVIKGTRETEFFNIIAEPTIAPVSFGKNNRFRRLDHGGYLGGGVSIQLSSFSLFLETNYYHSLRNVDTQNASKNRSLSYSFGVFLRIPSGLD